MFPNFMIREISSPLPELSDFLLLSEEARTLPSNILRLFSFCIRIGLLLLRDKVLHVYNFRGIKQYFLVYNICLKIESLLSEAIYVCYTELYQNVWKIIVSSKEVVMKMWTHTFRVYMYIVATQPC